MSVVQSLSNLVGLTRLRSSSSAPQALKPYLPVDDGSATDFKRARSTLIKLYQQLEKLADLAGIETRFQLDLPDARSSSGLGLDLTATAATLNSIEEINATPTSFSPFGPTWNDLSTAELTIGGVYDGSSGSDTLDLEVRRAGIHGVNDLRIRITDSQGSPVSTINIRDHEPQDQQYDIGNGLFLTLGPGALTNRDLATIQVYDSVGSVVDTTKQLGGIRNNSPNLEFGTPSIVNGAFSLNGESISVATTDTIDDVITRINQSSAGVTASFSALTERIDFLQNTTGSAALIDLQNDTSNLLQALKLSGATATPGIDPESEQTLAAVAEFSSVQDGNILINDVQIAIDTSSDSLSTVISNINASAAGVTASFDSDTQQVIIESNDTAQPLVIDNNGTGFFAALNMVDGRVDPAAVSNGVSRQRSYDIGDAAAAAFKELSYLFRDSSFVNRDATASQFRAPLESALRGLFGSDLSGTVFGLQLNGSDEARLRGDFATIDRRSLTQSLQLRGDSVQSVLIEPDGGGLLPDLLLATRQALSIVNSSLGLSGSLIDTYS